MAESMAEIEHAVVSVCRDKGLSYPLPEDQSPPENFPEYPFPGAPPGKSGVYALLRRCLQGAGADAANFGTPAWNPLGDWIPTGSKVFVLPNLVVNRRDSENLNDFQGKCTDGSVVRAVIDYAGIATGDPSLVQFGNASLQSCEYESVTDQAGMSAIGKFYQEHTGTAQAAVDLRAVVTRWKHGALLDRREQSLDDIVLVDLGKDSLLDSFYRNDEPVNVRISDYDIREIASYHGPGRHVYAVHRSVLEADTIISVPKLKTHEKVGITCALKGTVGSIARKECLAHHRKGGPKQHGDEFPRSTIVHELASNIADRVTMLSTGFTSNVIRVAGKGLYKILRFGRKGIMAGAWHGNDTAWRMALDIARVLRFARPDGTIAPVPQRRHLAVIDGIVGGEAEGPVFPTGFAAGVLIFGSDPVWTDFAAARVMHFDPALIPLISVAASDMRYPATSIKGNHVSVSVEGVESDFMALDRIVERSFVPPKGWIGHIGLQ